MGRIGKSYPRFEHSPVSAGEPCQGETGSADFQVAGAAIGVLAALGLIAWLMMR